MFIKSDKLNWISVDANPNSPFEASDRPVVARVGDMPPYHRVRSHQHEWGQIAFASKGILTLKLPEGRYIVPPDKALWIPRQTQHEVSTRYGAHFRSLYLGYAWSETLPSLPYVFSVSHLLRELILAVTQLPENYPIHGRNQHLLALLLEEIKQAESTSLFIPMPRDKRLAAISNQLHNDPANNASLEQWQHIAGASIRTINRLFNQETGMGFNQWRQRLRVFYALEHLSQGSSVTQVSLDMGYESVSAFTTMFKKQLGVSPRTYMSQW